MCARSWTAGLLVAIILGEVKSMSLNEILDFSSYLERSSLIDKPRIDGLVLEGHLSEEPSDGDDAASIDAWELSGKFEGDIILNARQRRVIVEDVAEGLSRNGLKDITKRWPNNQLVYFIQKEHFSSGQVQAIMDGLDDIARSSCITFRPYKKGDMDAVVIVGNRRGCFSAVGYQGGYQVLNLSSRHPLGRGCFRHGTVVHEVLHSLGFYHMQSSPDRDDYIDVKWDNIIEGAKHNFRKYNTFSVSDFGVPYDYDSVLHYSKKAFSKNGQLTLVPKKGGAEIGQRSGMSSGDSQKLNRMYCDNNDADDVKEPPNPKKAAPLKKKNNRNKPFEGHGLGYYKGRSIIVKLPKLETIEIDSSALDEAPHIIGEYTPPRFNVRENPTYSNPTVVNPVMKNEESDEVFIDISKLMSGIGPYYKPSYENVNRPKVISSNDNDNHQHQTGDGSNEGRVKDHKVGDYNPLKNRAGPTDTVHNDYRSLDGLFADSRKRKNNHIPQDTGSSRGHSYPDFADYRRYSLDSIVAPHRTPYEDFRSFSEPKSARQSEKYNEDFVYSQPTDSTEEEFNLYSIPAAVRDWFVN